MEVPHQTLRVRPGLGFFGWPELIVMTAASLVFIVFWLTMGAAFACVFWSASPILVIALSPIGLFPPLLFGFSLYVRWTCFGAVVPPSGRIILSRRYLRPGIPLTTQTVVITEAHRIIVRKTSEGRHGEQFWAIGLSGREGCDILAGEYRSEKAAHRDAARLAERLNLRLVPAPGCEEPSAMAA